MNRNELLASIMNSSLPNYGVEVNFHKVSFPFLLHHVFGFRKEDDGENFSLRLFSLLFCYMDKWMNLNQKNDSEKNREALYDFQRSVDLNQIFRKVYGELNNSASIGIPVSNAKLVIKRFGECLGLNLVSRNGNPEIHETGIPILESFCTGEYQARTGMVEFMHSIECIVPLPRRDRENNSVTIDFFRVHEELTKACPCISWRTVGEFVANIMAAYVTPPDNERAMIGNSIKCVLPITAELIHYRGNDLQKSLPWRKGNVENFATDTYRFSEGKDLCLSLKVSCPFPQDMSFMREVPVELEVGEIQGDLRSTGASMYAQLCAMMVGKYY